MKLILASNNSHKLEEFQSVINGRFELVTLREAGIDIDIPEPFDTLEANASAKSSAIWQLTGRDCFGEDTGLEVESLGGEPGVKSARYAGDGRSFDKNIEKLLTNLLGKANRKACFRAVISLILSGEETQFEGFCHGQIIEEKRGSGGFGYDPVFVPDGSHKTLAEMDLQEKNHYSHRAKAAEKLVVFLSGRPGWTIV